MSEISHSIERDSVIEVTRAVCECLLGDLAEPCSQRRPLDGTDELVASVTITGVWSGDVSVRLSPALATRLAREIFEIDPTSVDEVGVRDVLGEVANMIGGNLKALLPEPSRLSLPRVVRAPRGVGSELTQAFVVGSDDFEVSVKGSSDQPMVRS
ncbi:MAG: chemotaxis protein CheX [Deltaproteobacteria bacterium]|nr:chemotaxis protein CheX [Deltaproteobacteria bacterium]